MAGLNEEVTKPRQPPVVEEPPGPVPRPPSGTPDADGRRARERRRKLMRGARQGLLGLLILAAAGAVVLALRPRPVPVDVSTAGRGGLVVAIEETGVARVKDRYVVSAPV